MISQALITRNNEVLMVRQYVQRGDIVWNYPGGGIEEGETPEEACIREVKEETGFEVEIIKLLNYNNDKYTFKAEIIGGALGLDKSNKDNDDIIEIAWIKIEDEEKFDTYTRPIIDQL
ncbi:NUDIX domain-containing protein [Paenibacillus sp. AK002]